jgi:hypothetical protein
LWREWYLGLGTKLLYAGLLALAQWNELMTHPTRAFFLLMWIGNIIAVPFSLAEKRP